MFRDKFWRSVRFSLLLIFVTAFDPGSVYHGSQVLVLAEAVLVWFYNESMRREILRLVMSLHACRVSLRRRAA
jgi:hypothetical protein